MRDHAISEISIRGVHKLLADESGLEQVVDYVDKLLGALLALSPLALGHAGLALYAFIEPKSELLGVVKSVVGNLADKKKQFNFSERCARLAAANCIITYSAYFDMVHEQLPDLMKAIDLQNTEKLRLSIEALDRAPGSSTTSSSIRWSDYEFSANPSDLTELTVAVRHPSNDAAEDRLARTVLYDKLNERMLHFFSGLLIWEDLQPDKKKKVTEFFKNRAMALANAAYAAQYLTLAIDFNDFFVWSMFQEFEALKSFTAQMSAASEQRQEVLLAAYDQIDVGMTALTKAVELTSPSVQAQSIAGKVGQTLHRKYSKAVERPVIEDTYGADEAVKELAYPPKVQAFVPQAYKTVRYDKRTTHLEDEREWDARPSSGDLGPFLLRYLQSPYSAEAPMLILGHPGSGKSLLTEILAARLAYPEYTTIRVELRDINPASDIRSQIEEQLDKDTGRGLKWVSFSENLIDNPPLVILDGYDELLQASGKVHADYLDRVQRFQEQENFDGRQVRIIVTSRVTLIDKAIVPAGTAVVRLLDFDRPRQSAWVDIWNRYNSEYFNHHQVTPFDVPNNPKIDALAAQPLLLLMLAIYDSDNNQLSRQESLDQTILYDSLLRRFIIREKAKGEDGVVFMSLPDDERSAILDEEMTRLGVAAMSMFNRQAVHIRKSQLEQDIQYFHTAQPLPGTPQSPLSQGDLLLGSFFFIHESRTGSDANSPTNEARAFEFLHNTFGEFLTADFILRRVLVEARVVCEMSASELLRSSLHERLINMNEEWFACLIYTLLDTRPVIVSMLREWARHSITRLNLAPDDIYHGVHTIVTNQLKAILDGEVLVNVSPRGTDTPYKRLPALGHLAIYSLNLVVLATVISQDGVSFTNGELGGSRNGAAAWDRLIGLWRTWMSSETLIGAADQIWVTRRDIESVDIIFAADAGNATLKGSMDPVRTNFHASRPLGDYLLAGLSGVSVVQQSGATDALLRDLKEVLEFNGMNSRKLVSSFELKAADQYSGFPNYDFDGVLGRGLGDLFYFEHLDPYISQAIEVLSRAPLSARMAYRRDISPLSISDLMKMGSRYDVELLVEVSDRLESRWLFALLESVTSRARDQDPDSRRVSWPAVLRTTCAAPVLRAVVETMPPGVIEATAETMSRQLKGRYFRSYDVETAVLVAAIGQVAVNDKTRTVGLSTVSRHLTKEPGQIVDLPLSSFGLLADALCSDGANWGQLRAVIAAAVPAAIEVINSVPGDSTRSTGIEMLIHGLRVGMPSSKEVEDLIYRAVSTLGFNIGNYPSNKHAAVVALLAKYARGSADPEAIWLRLWVLLSGPIRPDSDLNVDRKLDASSWKPWLFVMGARKRLTVSQSDDLGWADDVLQRFHGKGIDT